MEILKAIFNRGLFRALTVIFAAALVLIPFTSISDERVNIPDRSSFEKQVEKDSAYVESHSNSTSKSQEITKTSTATESATVADASTAQGITVAANTDAEPDATDAAITPEQDIELSVEILPETSPKSKTKPKVESESESDSKPKPESKPKSKNSKDSKDPKNLVKNPSSNRDKIWNYLLENGYTEKQTAGIMGNLQQEHEFQTSGDGLAQWNGDRRAKLRKMKNPQSLKTQLEFLVQVELKGSYSDVNKAIKACTTIDEATQVFCNRYERPGIPLMNKRLAYAHRIYKIYHK